MNNQIQIQRATVHDLDMNQPKNIISLIVATLSLWIALWAPRLMALEEPRFEIVSNHPAFELRRYAPYLVAEVGVSGDFDEVGKQAFGILADYIFGNNRPSEKMAMTAPVSQRPAVDTGIDIGMTAPVTQKPTETDGDYVVSFVMPSRFTLASLPDPVDQRISLREEPARLMASRRYSGRWTRENYRQNEEALLQAVEMAGLAPLSPPVYARYNSPFALWFLRRNEVMVRVSPPSDGSAIDYTSLSAN